MKVGRYASSLGGKKLWWERLDSGIQKLPSANLNNQICGFKSNDAQLQQQQIKLNNKNFIERKDVRN